MHQNRRLQLKITAIPVAVLIAVQALSVARSPFTPLPIASGRNALISVGTVSLFAGVWLVLVNLLRTPRSTERVESIGLIRSKTWLAVALIVFLIFVAVLGPGLGPLGDDPRLNPGA